VKRKFVYVLVALLLSLSSLSASAQAPSISYSPTTNVFTVGTAITALTPTNAGGAVPATVYGTVTTYAGSGALGSGNGIGTAASFRTPRGIVFDYAATPNMFIADAGNNSVRKIVISSALVSTFSTSTVAAYGIAYDGTSYYLLDNTNSLIHKVSSAGTVTTFTTSGIALSSPSGMVYDPVNTVFYISNSGNHKILKMTTAGVISVFAGSGTAASVDATGAAASFSTPNGVAVDASGNVYVADQGNNEIRKITPAGVVTTIAGSTTAGNSDGNGTAASFDTPSGIDVDISGNIYVTDRGNELIRMITPGGDVTTVAGDGTAALTNGVGTAAEFNQSRGISVYKTTGDIYVADYGNNVIRKIIGTGYSISPALPAGLTFNNSTGKISGTPTASSPTTTYTITAFNASGSSSTTITILCSRTIDWDGSSSSTWSTTANWTPAVVPTSADNVRIGVSTFNNQPTVTGSTSVQSITFGSAKTATVTVNTNRTLTINGSITVNASTTATITAGGTGSSLTMAPGSFITVNGTKLTISTSSFTLQSDATGSASIGPVTTTNFVTSGTTVNVQRYVTGGSSTYRGYRLLSSPVYAATVGSNNFYNLDYIKSSTLVTGVSTANGFDKAGNPSLFLFREDIAPSFTTYGAGNWPGVSKINGSPTYLLQLNSVATNYSLMPGSGFLLFFRGDRTTNLANKYTAGTSAEAVTFSASGTLNVGQITAKDWYTSGSSNLGYTSATANSTVRGFNLVGNPYPSNIDWDTYQVSTSSTGIYGVNIDNTMYMLDPISKNYGAYIAGNNQLGTNNVTNIIPSGAGFFVRATNTNPQLIFNESAKTTTQAIGAHIMLGIPVASAPLQYMRIKMIKDSVSTDETMIRIKSNGALSFVNNLDAVYKQGNGAVNLASFTTDHVDIAIKAVPLPKLQAESLALDVNATTTGIYKLTLRDIVAVPRLYDVWLMDTYKKDSLDMRQNITYSFYINKTDSTTFGSKRFNLVIRQNAAYAYHLLDFVASKLPEARQVQVLWQTVNEGNYTNFTVERSTDNGATFKVLGVVDAAGASSYSFIDKSPVNGTNLYRLKQEDVNNAISYSRIVTIQYSNLSNGIVGRNLSIYPNPAISNINLAIASQNSTASVYNIRFMSSSGIMVKEATSSQANWQGSISNLQPGTYIIQVFDNRTQNLIGENKFVKL